MRAFVEKRKPRYMELRELAASGGSSEFVWGPPAGDCPDCGAAGIPALFTYCGACGASLNGAAEAGVGEAESEVSAQKAPVGDGA